MKRDAWLSLGALVGLTVLAFQAPVVILAWLAVMMSFQGRFGLGKARTGFLWFVGISLVFNTVLLGFVSPGTGTIGPLSFGIEGAIRGAMGAIRLAAVVGVNLAWLQEENVAAVLDGLRLPRSATVFLAAILIAVQDVGRDFSRMVEGRRMMGTWPEGRLNRVRAAAQLVTPLMVASLERARVRKDALQVARLPVPKMFVPIVALTALALAGRMALLAVPNVSLVAVVVFVAGLVFGPAVAIWVAILSMGISDLLLSGVVPSGFVNVPAMAMIGLLGGILRRVNFSGTPGRAMAAIVGFTATIGFSVVADVGDWLLIPEFRGDTAYLRARIAAGLIFNIVPAVLHAVLFALVCGPVQQIFTTRRGLPSSASSPSSPTARP